VACALLGMTRQSPCITLGPKLHLAESIPVVRKWSVHVSWLVLAMSYVS